MKTALLGGASILGGGTLLVGERVLAAPRRTLTFPVVPIQILNVDLNGAGSALTVAGAVGNSLFGGIPLAPTAIPAAAGATPILNLHLGAINLNLLGLQVQTSEICLAVTAVPGPGNLLGNLLAGLANALNGGTSLATFLAGLSDADRGILLGGLAQLLTQALGAVFSSQAVPAVQSQAGVNVLTLSLGPLNLNLLGLVVHLDNCNNGPVTVRITAVPGPGNLLGNLIAGLANLLNRRQNANKIFDQLLRIAGEIARLVGAAAPQVRED